jgi:hypothetical protein
MALGAYYGSKNESLNESDDKILHHAARMVVGGIHNVESAAKKYGLHPGELQGEVNLIKDHIAHGNLNRIQVFKDLKNEEAIIVESTKHLVSWQQHAIKARRAVEQAISSQLHHHYDNNHIAYSSAPIEHIADKLKELGYSHDDTLASEGLHEFHKHDESKNTDHYVTIKPDKYSDKLVHVTMEHNKRDAK